MQDEKLSTKINLFKLKSLALKICWVLDKITSDNHDIFTVQEILKYFIDVVNFPTSWQAIQYAIKTDKKSIHKISKGKYKLMQPGKEKLRLFIEEDSGPNKKIIAQATSYNSQTIFPPELIKKLPSDLGGLCAEFNFNFKNKQPMAGMLLLRRLLPLSIVRKFQKINKENEIKNNNEYIDTRGLLTKVAKYLQNKRCHKEILNYKLLIDSSQHSYAFSAQMTDVEGGAIKLRVFLEELL